MPSLTDCLEVAIRAAHAGAAVLCEYQKQPDTLVIDFKGRNDLVSQADRESEKVVIEVLQKGTPQYAIIAEESGSVDGNRATWHIDPLDGTTNYLHNLGHFAVSIGLIAHAGTPDAMGNPLEEDTPVLGVVYDPSREEIFTGMRGVGAWLNNHRIQHSTTTDPADALIAAGIQVTNPEDLSAYMGIVEELARTSRGVRRLGAAALDLAWVACGRLDGYVEEKLESWDVVAGTVIAREAGALVTDPLEHDSTWPSNGRIVAAPEPIHAYLTDIYQRHMG